MEAQATFVDTQARLDNLIGKRGTLKTRDAGEFPFIFMTVEPPRDLPKEADKKEFITIVTRCDFVVRFDEGTLIDRSNTRRISGFDISHIDPPY
jgi:hypothetical protein